MRLLNKKIFIILLFAITIICFLFIFLNQSTLHITSTSPANNSTSINLNPSISFTFSKALTDQEKTSVSVEANPSFAHETQWSPDNKTLFISLSSSLNSSQTYKVTVHYLTSSSETTFTTVNAQNVPLQEQLNNQTQADKNFGDWQKAVLDQYPWYNSLPIQTDDYFVYFDLDSKSFIAKLYPSQSAPITTDQQVDLFKNEIINQLKSLGIDTSAYTINFSTTIKP